MGEKAAKWAGEFEALKEDDQYTFLEELAPKLTRMHLQFLQGIIGFDDEGEEEEDFGESDEGEEGSEDDGEEGVPGDADGDDE